MLDVGFSYSWNKIYFNGQEIFSRDLLEVFLPLLEGCPMKFFKKSFNNILKKFYLNKIL